MKAYEHNQQVSLIHWCNHHSNTYPLLKLIFAIPNGGHRDVRTAARLKAEGVKPGVPDLFLPIPNDTHHGLFIEMKYGTNKVTPNQAEYIKRLQAQGYRVEVCYSLQAATDAVQDYIGIVLE